MITGEILDPLGQLVYTVNLQITGLGLELMIGLLLGAIVAIPFWLTAKGMTRK